MKILTDWNPSYSLMLRLFDKEEDGFPSVLNLKVYHSPQISRWRIIIPFLLPGENPKDAFQFFKKEGRKLIGDWNQRFLTLPLLQEKESSSSPRYLELQSGYLSLGAQRNDYVEFFVPGDNWIRGRFLFRKLPLEELKSSMTEVDEALLGEAETAWVFWVARDNCPYLFSEGNSDFHWKPLFYPALPQRISKSLPRDLKFWTLRKEDPSQILEKKASELPPPSEETLQRAKKWTLEHWKFTRREEVHKFPKPWQKK